MKAFYQLMLEIFGSGNFVSTLTISQIGDRPFVVGGYVCKNLPEDGCNTDENRTKR